MTRIRILCTPRSGSHACAETIAQRLGMEVVIEPKTEPSISCIYTSFVWDAFSTTDPTLVLLRRNCWLHAISWSRATLLGEWHQHTPKEIQVPLSHFRGCWIQLYTSQTQLLQRRAPQIIYEQFPFAKGLTLARRTPSIRLITNLLELQREHLSLSNSYQHPWFDYESTIPD
jgi:hypothetical protein